jgi:hypothetical protein
MVHTADEYREFQDKMAARALAALVGVQPTPR